MMSNKYSWMMSNKYSWIIFQIANEVSNKYLGIICQIFINCLPNSKLYVQQIFMKYLPHNKYLGAEQKEPTWGAVCGQPGAGEEEERGGISISFKVICTDINIFLHS